MAGSRRAWAWAIVTVCVLALAGGAVWALRAQGPEAAAPVQSKTATPALATPTPTPTPTVTEYDLAGLPKVDVLAVIPALPLDDDRDGAFTGEVVHPVVDKAPVFADPGGTPVAYLPRDDPYDGTTVPVIDVRDGWVKVLLAGRQHTPSKGNAAQVAGWLRTADVSTETVDARIEVDISDHRIDIVRGKDRTRVTNDFAWGTDDTPTPHGRAFVMMVRKAPSLGYTRGHPVVYLSVQSPTLDGFGGADVAVTAFHYHDVHSGAISNGCIRVGVDAITALSALPPGTPVTVRP